MNPTSKPQRFRPSSVALKEIRKFSPVKTIGKNTEDTKKRIREGMESAHNISSAGADRKKFATQLVLTTKPNKLKDALSIKNPEEQQKAFEAILKELYCKELECHEDILKGVYELILEDSDSKIKDREHLQEFCIKFIVMYWYRHNIDDLIEDINKLKINQKVWYEIATHEHSYHHKHYALQAALQITDEAKQQAALLIIATNLSNIDCSYQEECSAVLNAALKITDEGDRSAALYALVQTQYMDEMFEAALEVTEANDRNEILFRFVEAASLLTNRTQRTHVFNLLSNYKGGYGLKKRLESLPVDPQLRKEKLKAIFAHPISSNADDQEALLKIHQQLCVNAQSLDEKIEWAAYNDFETVYANPELLPSVRLDHLSCINYIQKSILYDFLSKPLDTVAQQNYASESGLAIMQLLNQQQLACLNLRIIGLKRLHIMQQQQDKLINGLRLIVINRKTMAPPVDIEGSFLKNDPNEVTFYENIITSLDKWTQVEVLENNFNGKDFDADMMMKLLEAYNKHMISRKIIPFINAGKISFGSKWDIILDVINKFYKRNKYPTILSSLFEILNRIMQSDTLSKELQCKSLELQIDQAIQTASYSIHQPVKQKAYRPRFQAFFRQLDPEISDESLEMLSSPNVMKEEISYTFKHQLIRCFKNILDQGKFQRTKVAPREDDVS
jgi:hypothetical protein